MRGAFRSRHDQVVRVLDAGVNDYLERMTAHYASADTMREQRTTRETGERYTHTSWDARDLRAWGHEMELAQECEQAMYECARGRYRAQMTAYAHTCLCRVRVVRPRPVVFTLAQVAHLFAENDRKRTTNAPPGQLRTRTVLATCHASNAPGLSAHSQHTETGRT